MNHNEKLFAYKREGVQGLLDTLPADARIRVRIPGRGESEMTVAELSRQIATLRPEDIGPDAIKNIEVEVLN